MDGLIGDIESTRSPRPIPAGAVTAEGSQGDD
jgi:hypothetical protein